MTLGMLGASLLACGVASPAPAPVPTALSSARTDALSPGSMALSRSLPEVPSRPPPPPPLACGSDADCGYDPERDQCIADPRANRQPPLQDQGLVCYCDEGARLCALLRVPPVPCESDASCAVRVDPRPHPVAASAAQPHERGRACRDFVLATTCERTNICTMHHVVCPAAKARTR